MLNHVRFVKALAGSLRRDDRGAAMVEYALLVMLIAVVVVPALIVLGPIVAGWYTAVVAGF
jgi:pilus assembly protein Flp/PilA